jgi:2-polyprenyl-3-methyl-5-hydroxy-6-metoxy-1,4-benzoquinol methylase
MYNELEKISSKPKPYEFYTADELWTDDHTSKKMLEFHLDEHIDVSSRKIKFIEESLGWMSSFFSIGNSTSICDFGCGPGLYTSRLAERGAEVTGIDFSKRSIDYAIKTARQKKLKIDYVNQNYLSFKTDKKFDLITMIMCDFCALSPEQRKVLLQIFGKLLKPNGSILLDVYSLESFGKRMEKSLYEVNLLNQFWSPNRYYGFLNTFKYYEEKVILDKFTIAEKNRIRTIYNWLQYFSPVSLKNEFEANGFIITDFFSDVAGAEFSSTSDEFAVVAKKIT